MGLFKRKNGYYYIKINHNSKQIKISTKTRAKSLAVDIYRSLLKKIVFNQYDKKTNYNNENKENKLINKNRDYDLKICFDEYISTCKSKGFVKAVINIKNWTLTKLTENKFELMSDFNNQDKINNFFMVLENKKYSNDSKHNFIKEIRAFLNYCIKKGYFTTREYKKIVLPSFKKNSRNLIINDDDFKKIYENIEQNNDLDFKFYLETLYFTVSRPNEVSQLKLSDFDIENKRVNVFQNKTKKVKEVYIPEIYIEKYKEYIKNHNIGSYVFIGNDKNKEFYSKKFKKLKIDLNLNKLYTLYTVRHTSITNLMNSINDIEFVAKQAGNNPEIALKHYVNRNITHYQELIEKAFSK